MVLKKLIFNQCMLWVRNVVVFERTHFSSFYFGRGGVALKLWEGVVVLKKLIFNHCFYCEKEMGWS